MAAGLRTGYEDITIISEARVPIMAVPLPNSFYLLSTGDATA
jgi:hypothetical protein